MRARDASRGRRKLRVELRPSYNWSLLASFRLGRGRGDVAEQVSQFLLLATQRLQLLLLLAAQLAYIGMLLVEIPGAVVDLLLKGFQGLELRHGRYVVAFAASLLTATASAPSTTTGILVAGSQTLVLFQRLEHLIDA